ncbi:MAG: glycosyltransferase family 2 protein [Acidobacteriia bacterium]|nr:glycosyltransferase family 2 protein [Terriglobia bacterium]
MTTPAPTLALIIPALNEVESIGPPLAALPRHLFAQILVVDNGSTDGTADAARAAGAEVIVEPRRGYGRACRAGLAALRPETSAVMFMDADLSDDPADVKSLVKTLATGGWDLVVGSRVLGRAEPGSLTPVQRFGNWLTTRLLRWLWGVRFTDLGPLRIVSRAALLRLDLRDPDYGWNVEMQVKAVRLGLAVTEIPVNYRRRRFGRSKISGTVLGSARAGFKILWTVYRCWHASLDTPRGPQHSQD